MFSHKTLTLAALIVLFLTSRSSAGEDLYACGYHELDYVIEQVPADWPDHGVNNQALWTWNQTMDIYRVAPDDGDWDWGGGWGTGSNEFVGWPTDDELHAMYGIHYNGAAVHPSWWLYPCAEMVETDIAFNPAYSWTFDRITAEDSGSIFYTTILMHELGHSWGEQTYGESLDYDEPSVMHGYYHNMVQPAYTIHTGDAWLMRRQYDNQRAAPNTADMGVFSHYANAALHNTVTDKFRYDRGESITVRGLTVENIGNLPLSDVRLRLYLSRDRAITTSDTLIGEFDWAFFPAESLGVYDLSTTIPSRIGEGTYRVGAIVTSNGYGSDQVPTNTATYLYDPIEVVVSPFDDRFEENDHSGEATLVGKGGSYSNLVIRADDNDWFRLWVEEGDSFHVSAWFDHASGNLDAFLYNPTLELVDSSATNTDDEHVGVLRAEMSGYYYVGIQGRDGAENGYDVDVSVDTFAFFASSGEGLAGSGSLVPRLTGTQGPAGGDYSMLISNAFGGATAMLWAGVAQSDLPYFGGHLYVSLTDAWVAIPLELGGRYGGPGRGSRLLPGVDWAHKFGLRLFFQVDVLDAGAPDGHALTDCLELMIGR